MAEIIRLGDQKKKEYIGTCPECDSEILFQEAELITGFDHLANKPYRKGFCPVCGGVMFPGVLK